MKINKLINLSSEIIKNKNLAPHICIIHVSLSYFLMMHHLSSECFLSWQEKNKF